jgi:cobyrinic acid a,c-diamide synthase
MVGVISASTRMRDRPVGRGLVRIAPNVHHPWRKNSTLPAVVDAHEFHYSELLDLTGSRVFAYDVIRGYGANGDSDGVIVGHTLASFVHQRHTRANPWLHNFVNYMHHCRSKDSNVNQAY